MTDSNVFRVACLQTAGGGASLDDVDELLADAHHADLAVLPELFHTEYFGISAADRRDEALELEGPFVQGLASLATEYACHILAPIYLQVDVAPATYFNSALMLSPSGTIAFGTNQLGDEVQIYHKTHLCDVDYYGGKFQESAHFSSGNNFVAWDIKGMKVGVLICYDRHFPEAWLSVRSMGVDVICVPYASPTSTKATFFGELQGMALQFGVYVAASGRAGFEGLPSGEETDYLGGSCVIAPDGRIVAQADMEQPQKAIVAACDHSHIEDVRQRLPFMSHRRHDIYSRPESRRH